jgi:hypothetical protein
MTNRRTFLQGGAALAAAQLLADFPVMASPAMTLWQDSKNEYFRRVRLYCQIRFRVTMALCMTTDGPFHEYASFFLYAPKMWSHIGRNTLDQIALTTDRPATLQVIEAVDAEVLKWMTIAAEHPVKHPWLDSFPYFVKRDMLSLVERKAATESQSLREVQAFLREVPFRTPWKEIA